MICYAAGPDCDGVTVRHHLLKRQRIRAAWKTLMAAHRRGGPKPWSVTKAIADPRNLVWTCARHHKEEWEMPVPDGFWDFVTEYALEGALPRWMTYGAAAPTTALTGRGAVVDLTAQPSREEAA